jgi:hypothetical protein
MNHSLSEDNGRTILTLYIIFLCKYTAVDTGCVELARHVGKVKNGDYVNITSKVHITNQFQTCHAYFQDIQTKRRVRNA